MAPNKPTSGKRYRVGIITLSDKGARGEREDASGALIKEMMSGAGYDIESYCLLPDEKELLKGELRRLADNALADLVLTTGGTGFSPRDWTPEATLEVAERFVPGIPEAMRAGGMAITKRAMLSRAVSVIRGKTLIINLPGSPKAVRENLEFIIDVLPHALEILSGEGGECAR
ncbi:MAG: MogA/MoaB family molybdenum cofactor biosynthesis protein [Spirochaetaceae bacterium]|jgi:molybdenum cofactor synthesis domain-containing protein|nr:MogA/MoaB family molybdenum cofactor biosynthesis protein [Spirochaetaceae bacterium]